MHKNLFKTRAMTRRSALLGAGASFAFASIAHAAKTFGVVATTSMIADAVSVIGGDNVHVKALIGPGVAPHSFRQTRTDIVAMTRADLTLHHGLYLEAQLEEFLNKLGRRRKVVPVAEALNEDLLIAHEDYPDKFDPHVWMVPELWTNVVREIAAVLIENSPNSASEMKARTEAYIKEIDAVGAYARDALESVPEESRVLITAHDAFDYFGQAYGFEVIGIQGISTESEAGLKRIADLVDLLVERDIRAVFVETSVSDRNIRAVIEGAAARGHDATIGGELYSDSMGIAGSYEGTYLGMIDHNATVITRALGGKAPEAGWRGLLVES